MCIKYIDMSYKIIVARYNEDISWLNNEINNCIIYNKGEKLHNIENEICLENVGRESDTYLHYIIKNYDNLPDIIIFTQAKISDHRGKNDVNYLIKLKNQALQYGKSNPYYTHSQDTNTKHSRNIHSCWNDDWNLENDTFYLKNNYKNNTPIIFKEWFINRININYPNPMHIYCNGIFAVKKELIHKHKREYYEQLILEVNHHINSTEGHFFERSWYYLFD